MAGLTISHLARSAGVGVETVRYYQRRGLLPVPPRVRNAGSSGIRQYDASDTRRLRFIRIAQAAGFTLDEIGELLTLDATDDRPRVRDMAQKRVALLDAKIAELQEARAALDRLARRCAKEGEGPCPILAAFEP